MPRNHADSTLIYIRNALWDSKKLSDPIVKAGVFPDTLDIHGWEYDMSNGEDLRALWLDFDMLKPHSRPLDLMQTISNKLGMMGYCLHYMSN